jgi:Phosphatidate cytidylyltransferase, mitochondrial
MTAHGGGEGLAGLVARNFPPIEHSFAYGSGVFAQAGLYGGDAAPGSASGPMLDFIFAVADPAAWHEQARLFLTMRPGFPVPAF